MSALITRDLSGRGFLSLLLLTRSSSQPFTTWGRVDIAVPFVLSSSHQPAVNSRNQDLFLLNLAGGFQHLLQPSEELIGRFDGVGKDLNRGHVIFLSLHALTARWMP